MLKFLSHFAQRLAGFGPHASESRRGELGHLSSPWGWERSLEGTEAHSMCNICRWSGSSFLGGEHVEAAKCPRCGSIGRDRFLFFCFIHRMSAARYRVLETSPRLGEGYVAAMRRWFDYKASDFDQRSHRADLAIDLQDIDLGSDSVDVVLTAHVLEHVPDTDRALEEIFRILAPGGTMYLQVPVLQGETAVPAAPEFHEDTTAVEWRFGPDLTARLRDHGFQTRLLCTDELARTVEGAVSRWPEATAPEFDVESLLEGLRIEDLEPVADEGLSRRLGLRPAYMFLTWEATKVAER